MTSPKSLSLAQRSEADFQTALQRARSALGRCLPAGSVLTTRAAEVPRDQRYWLLRRDETLIALLPQHVEIGAVDSLGELRRRAAVGELGKGVTDITTVGLAIPPGSAWPLAPQLLGDQVPALIARRDKHIVFPLDPATGAVGGVIKLPLGATVGRNCRREYAVLSDLAAGGIAAGPRPLGVDDARGAYGYEYLLGTRVRSFAAPTLIGWLDRLRGHRLTTPSAEAARYRQRIDPLPLRDECKLMLHRWLDEVTDSTEIACGALHGDFAGPNLLRGEDRRIRAIDWEFGDRDAIGFLDLVEICFATEAWTATSLPSLFSPEVRRRVTRLWELAFPAPRPRLKDLFYLSFCLHYINRVEVFLPDEKYVVWLDRLLCNPAPL